MRARVCVRSAITATVKVTASNVKFALSQGLCSGEGTGRTDWSACLLETTMRWSTLEYPK